MNKTDYIMVCQQCIKNIKGLLTGVNSLLENEITKKYALGLYMYAVEEYGKVWLLKKFLENKKDGELPDPAGIFDNNSHNRKIEEGFKNLPGQCRNLSPSLEIKVNASAETQIIKLENGSTVYVPAGATGLFQNVSDSQKYIELDFKTRCFYIDSVPKDNEERSNLFEGTTTLKHNTSLFNNAIEKCNLN